MSSRLPDWCCATFVVRRRACSGLMNKISLYSTLVANEPALAPWLCEDSCARLHPRRKRVTSKECKVRLPKQRHRLKDAQKPREGGGASCGGTAVTGQWWHERKGGDPRTDQVTKGLTQNSRADRQRPNYPSFHRKRYSRNSLGGVSAQKGRSPKSPVCEGDGTQGPWRRGATGCSKLSRQLQAC